MIFKSFCLLSLIIFTVKSENNTFSIMQNILLECGNTTTTTSHKNISPWCLKQVINFLNCGPFPKLNNSSIQYIIKWEEQKIYLEQKCNRYFQANQQNATGLVCVNGKWKYQDKKCKSTTCPIFHKPAHSFMTNVTHTYNSVVYFSCFSGYSMRGNTTIRCQENQQWSSLPPVCVATKCLPPHPPNNGSVNNTNEVEIKKNISFSCSKPYNLKGESVLTCLQDGEWNFPAPVCTLKCFVPEIAGRVMTIEDAILKPRTLINEGGKVIYSCKRSFIPVTFGVVQCLSGKWYPDILCKKTCTIEERTGINFILSHNSSVVEYSCPAGETLVGNSTRTCLENGTWSGTLPRCAKSCQLLPEFGIYSYRYSRNLEYLPFGSLIPQGTEITYSCRFNYSMNSHKYLTCDNGVLKPQPICSYINRHDLWLSKKKILQYKSYSTMSVCATKYSCRHFGYNDLGCENIKCDTFNCVTVLFNNATSEIAFKEIYGSCCAMVCY